MSTWFDEQLRYREQCDNDCMNDAVDSIAEAVMGKRLKDALSQKDIAGSAIDEILRFYHCKWTTEEDDMEFSGPVEQVEYRMHPLGIRNRSVTLESGWYRTAIGAMLGTFKEDGRACALIPGIFRGYRIIDIKTGKRIKANRKTEKLIDSDALCFYKPLPRKSLKIRDLLHFMAEQLSLSDVVIYFLLLCVVTLLGTLTPMFTKWLFSDVLESGSVRVLVSLAVFMVCFSIGSVFLKSFNTIISSRIGVKQQIAIESAVMNRVLSLPPGFFKKYSSGELSSRCDSVNTLCSSLFSSVGMSGISSVFSLIYIAEIFAFAPSMVAPALTVTVLSIILTVITTAVQTRVTREAMEKSAKTEGITYATITGIQKIRLTGAEKRMFARWAKEYSKEAALLYNPPLFLKLSPAVNSFITLFGAMWLYCAALKNHVSTADYYAFNSAFALVSAAFLSLTQVAVMIANIKPVLEMARPILEAEPEEADNKERVTSLKGTIELSHVSFRYDERMPYVIDDLSLTVKPGEYIAVTGATGCGKSTLLRLLLGFEKPERGVIYYDGKDIESLDPETLRQHIGVVLQDGKLFHGDIFSNIVITAPQSSLSRAWEAAEIASIADDIRAMPMGMNTTIAEGQGGISGGQRQRLMIARAICPDPKILMFDEATSALDNVTQKKVSEAIDALKCTRIVIAHRLSTIKNAKRIIFLENGHITEEGTYEELIAKNGAFASLVARQRLDTDEDE